MSLQDVKKEAIQSKVSGVTGAINDLESKYWKGILDGEGVVSLLNIAAVSLSAAANDGDAAQLGQVKAYRDALQAQIDGLVGDHSRIGAVHVDTASGTLAEALALADSYDGKAVVVIIED